MIKLKVFKLFIILFSLNITLCFAGKDSNSLWNIFYNKFEQINLSQTNYLNSLVINNKNNEFYINIIEIIIIKTIFTSKTNYLSSIELEAFGGDDFRFKQKHIDKLSKFIEVNKNLISSEAKIITSLVLRDVKYIINKSKLLKRNSAKEFLDDFEKQMSFLKPWYYWLMKEDILEINNRVNLIMKEVLTRVYKNVFFLKGVLQSDFSQGEKSKSFNKANSTLEKIDDKKSKINAEKKKALKVLKLIENK
jgi:hypothetical protein